jgi:hypothetical protein
MNERIRELWSECVKKHTKTPMNWQNVADEFAELIVKECSQMVEDKFDFCGDEIIIAEQILKHFGVEE